MSEPQQPVFYDSSRKRQIFFSFFLYFVCVIAFIATCGFIVTIIETPILSSSSTEFHGRRENPSTIARSVNEWQDARIIDIPRARVAYYSHARARLRYVLRRDRALSDVKKRLAAEMKLDDASKLSQPRHILQSGSNPQITLAFYVEDEPSLDSLKQHCQQITHFAPAWLTLAPDGCTVINSEERYPASIDQQAEYFARKDGMIIMPVLQNFSKGILQTQVLHEMLASPTKQSRVISQLIATITAKKFQGINVDLESFSPDDRPLMTQFMTRLASEFHQRHLLVSQDVVVSSKAYDLAGLAAVNDFIVPMIYDEHSSGRLGAGPIASNNWFRTELANYMAAVPASKTVIGLAGYSYDWVIGSNSSNFMTFGAAASKAQSAMDGSDGIIQTDKRSGNPYFTYYDDSAGTGTSPAHIVWMQDAVTAYNQLLMASSYHPLGAALWRLGDEDPSIWDFLGKVPLSSLRSLDSNSLSKIDYGYFGIQPVGNGDILTVVGTPKIGQRRLTIDPNSGMITSELFTTYPSQYVVKRTGILDNNGVNKQKIVALTFDDGPDPRWTPQILNILNQFHVPATFFVVGENAEANPGIVQREWDEGMEIGNHSFTHPEMDLITHARIRLELDATQRVIEAITGHESKLFRAPNRADSDPASAADLAPVIDGDNLGYIFVGEQIDPNDWRPGITAAEIVSGPAGVVTTASTGNCILLHDAGGETREETVKALPPIIEKLKAEGYKFVLVSDLTGKSKAELFPEVTGSQRLYVMWDRFAFDASYWVSRILTFIFVLTIVLGIGRIIIFTTLALIQYKREMAPISNTYYKT